MFFDLQRRLGGASGPLEDLKRERQCVSEVRESRRCPREFREIENASRWGHVPREAQVWIFNLRKFHAT